MLCLTRSSMAALMSSTWQWGGEGRLACCRGRWRLGAQGTGHTSRQMWCMPPDLFRSRKPAMGLLSPYGCRSWDARGVKRGVKRGETARGNHACAAAQDDAAQGATHLDFRVSNVDKNGVDAMVRLRLQWRPGEGGARRLRGGASGRPAQGAHHAQRTQAATYGHFADFCVHHVLVEVNGLVCKRRAHSGEKQACERRKTHRTKSKNWREGTKVQSVLGSQPLLRSLTPRTRAQGHGHARVARHARGHAPGATPTPPQAAEGNVARLASSFRPFSPR